MSSSIFVSSSATNLRPLTTLTASQTRLTGSNSTTSAIPSRTTSLKATLATDGRWMHSKKRMSTPTTLSTYSAPSDLARCAESPN